MGISRKTRYRILKAFHYFMVGVSAIAWLFLGVAYAIAELFIFAYAYARHLAGGTPVSMEFEEINNKIGNFLFGED